MVILHLMTLHFIYASDKDRLLDFIRAQRRTVEQILPCSETELLDSNL